MLKIFYKALILILVIGVLSACSKLGKKDEATTKDINEWYGLSKPELLKGLTSERYEELPQMGDFD